MEKLWTRMGVMIMKNIINAGELYLPCLRGSGRTTNANV